MPSWNIHTAHAEKLLAEYGAERLGIMDANAFVFGNYVPDIYVGYLVKDTTKTIEYKDTHLARKAYIPLPRHDIFWRRYIEGRDDVSDVTLGTWTHLVCDNVYNAHTRAFIKKVHVKPGEQTRIAKQGDFAAFGHTLDISTHVVADDALIAQCAAFPQYDIPESDVRKTVVAACAFVDDNQEHFLPELPELALLTPEFFASAFAEAHAICVEGLLSRVLPAPPAPDGFSPTHGLLSCCQAPRVQSC